MGLKDKAIRTLRSLSRGRRVAAVALVAVLAGAAAGASVWTPGGFLGNGSIELSPTLTLHAVCDVATQRTVYVAESTAGGVAISLSERACEPLPDDARPRRVPVRE